ncbi:MAG: hypothetical protein ABI862_14470 [Ilumatobacteraceae bacterium]
MFNHLVRRALTAGIAIAIATGGSASAARPNGVLATFEGRTIDLSQSWGEARACNIASTGAACYRSEAQMDDALDAMLGTVVTATCSTSVRLYDGTSFGGTVVNISTTGALVSLSTVGFDNLTSSYKIGACAAKLYSGIGTGLYPGNTAANSQATAMVSG